MFRWFISLFAKSNIFYYCFIFLGEWGFFNLCYCYLLLSFLVSLSSKDFHPNSNFEQKEHARKHPCIKHGTSVVKIRNFPSWVKKTLRQLNILITSKANKYVENLSKNLVIEKKNKKTIDLETKLFMYVKLQIKCIMQEFFSKKILSNSACNVYFYAGCRLVWFLTPLDPTELTLQPHKPW